MLFFIYKSAVNFSHIACYQFNLKHFYVRNLLMKTFGSGFITRLNQFKEICDVIFQFSCIFSQFIAHFFHFHFHIFNYLLSNNGCMLKEKKSFIFEFAPLNGIITNEIFFELIFVILCI